MARLNSRSSINRDALPDKVVVLGIDPGLQLTGYALVCVEPRRPNLEPALIEAGVIRLKVRLSIDVRLEQLHHELSEIVGQYHPQVMAVEKLYAHYRHPTTAIAMGHARGVILLCARQHDMTVVDLPSTEVKKAITGYGHASKLQMQRAIQSCCSLAELPSPPDVADAIAVALCQARRLASGQA